jgi:hypothetical protein
MVIYPRANRLQPMVGLTLLAVLSAPQVYAATTQLRVMARVLPTKAVSAANSTVNLVSPNGNRLSVDLSADEKLALTMRAGYIPASLQGGFRVPGVHVIEINF